MRAKASTPGETALGKEQWRTRPRGAGSPPGIKHADTAPSGAFYADPEEAELAATAAAAARPQRGETAPPGSSPELSWLTGPVKTSFAEDVKLLATLAESKYDLDVPAVEGDCDATLPQTTDPPPGSAPRAERQGAVPPGAPAGEAGEAAGEAESSSTSLHLPENGGTADQASDRGSGEFRRHDPYQAPPVPSPIYPAALPDFSMQCGSPNASTSEGTKRLVSSTMATGTTGLANNSIAGGKQFGSSASGGGTFSNPANTSASGGGTFSNPCGTIHSAGGSDMPPLGSVMDTMSQGNTAIEEMESEHPFYSSTEADDKARERLLQFRDQLAIKRGLVGDEELGTDDSMPCLRNTGSEVHSSQSLSNSGCRVAPQVRSGPTSPALPGQPVPGFGLLHLSPSFPGASLPAHPSAFQPPQPLQPDPPPAPTQEVEIVLKRQPWEKLGLSWVASGGLILQGVKDRTPAATCGAASCVGLQLTHVDGQPIHTARELTSRTQGQAQFTLRFSTPVAPSPEAAQFKTRRRRGQGGSSPADGDGEGKDSPPRETRPPPDPRPSPGAASQPPS
eukprot:Hpha_TRINITY_DN15619_c4_g9::TRINITY_DN15619_c4_g9_i1::g.99412::m.99412